MQAKLGKLFPQLSTRIAVHFL